MKSERDGINPAAKPSGTGCVECLALWADGGSISADAPNAGISAAVTVHRISTHQNITPLRVIR
jgi:hypothetical protein